MTPTLFHVTHWKAGSTWVDRILRRCARDRIVLPQAQRTQFLNTPIQEGMIYPRVYVRREEFEGVNLPPDSRWFVVIRDLRDTLVSAYFSVKVSHVLSEEQQAQRDVLQELPLEEGLLWMFDHGMVAASAEIQRSWLGERLIRYEDLLDRDDEILERVLLEEWGLPLDRERFRRIVEECRFESATGRQRGAEDTAAHQRKGVAGDWRNHLSEPVKRAFKDRFGDLLIETGYERDHGW